MEGKMYLLSDGTMKKQEHMDILQSAKTNGIEIFVENQRGLKDHVRIVHIEKIRR